MSDEKINVEVGREDRLLVMVFYLLLEVGELVRCTDVERVWRLMHDALRVPQRVRFVMGEAEPARFIRQCYPTFTASHTLSPCHSVTRPPT